MSFRCAYSLDGQGYDFSSSYSKKYLKPSAPIAVPAKRPEFTRCAYSMDAQGHELSYPREYTSVTSTPTLSRHNSTTVSSEDGQWRAVYDLGQRPHVSTKDSHASTMAGSQ